MYLLDTHIFLWSLGEPHRLPRKISALLKSDTTIHLSSTSLWEISIKYSLGKLPLKGGLLPSDLPDFAAQTGIEVIAPEISTIANFFKLPTHKHHDPFDRMLAWQAICEKFTLVTIDDAFAEYRKAGLKTFG